MSSAGNVSVKRALLSVSDKTGVVELAQQLYDWGIELLSTGGTARLISKAGIPVVEVSRHTGFPEMMGGRIKTLHPKIHGGILGRRGTDEATMVEHGIPPIDLVVVNLYPFAKTVANPGCSLDEAIENIDIGGPAMVRSSAKNHEAVAIVVDPADYDNVLQEMRENAQSLLPETRFQLAAKAFAHTAQYDGMIAEYLANQLAQAKEKSSAQAAVNIEQRFPELLKLQFERVEVLRYGENPHQNAAFYRDQDCVTALDGSIAQAQQIQGKALSYNNIADTDAALNCVQQFAEPACVIVKHSNPCGVAVSSDLLSAYDRAYATDPESAFGGIIAFNRELDGATAKAIVDRQFVEVIIAPAVSEAAREFVSEKPSVRLLECGSPENQASVMDFKRVSGGFLVQDADQALSDSLTVVSRRTPSETEMADLEFAWKVAKFVKSNAIVYACDGMTMGVGAGQMSRVNSARIAAIKAEHAGLKVTGSVMASDAFFPFRDGIDNAAQAGVRAVIQPGGSMRDNEVITAADEHDMAMIFTGMRHFRH